MNASKPEQDRKCPRITYRLRTYFLLLLAIAVLVAFWARSFRQRSAVAELRRHGGVVHMGTFFEEDGALATIESLLFGDEFRRSKLVILNGCSFSQEHFHEIRYLAHIRSLDLTNTELPPLDVSMCACLDELEWLYLGHTNLTTDDLKYFRSSRDLAHLDLRKVRIRESFLQLAEWFPKLESLDISNTNIDENTIAKLAQLQNLQSLQLDATKLDGSAIVRLMESLTTEKLSLASTCFDRIDLTRAVPSLRELDLRNSRIANFSFLQTLPNLTKLDLQGTGFSDADVICISCCSSLRKLVLNRTNISTNGYERIRVSLPNCEVFWSPRRSG